MEVRSRGIRLDIAGYETVMEGKGMRALPS